MEYDGNDIYNSDIKLVKAEAFALRIINLHKYLRKRGERVMSKQTLRCGTSIGANIAESIYAESKEDLIHKLSISLKEASETNYWLRLLMKGGYISSQQYQSISKDCHEMLKILTSILRKLKARKE
ncbi:MAG: four helix bundle protein [Muribaculaceae bacterium]|nr:four helix bundle protein [Muribaculaceae bacterium]